MNDYGSYPNSYSFGNGDLVIITIISFIIAIFGGLVLYFVFLPKKNEGKYTGFLGWLYDFLSFKTMFAEILLKIGYILSAAYITILSLGILLFTEGGSIGVKLMSFLILIIGGNIGIRLIYEFLIMALVICRNTTEINKKLSIGNNFAEIKNAQPVQQQNAGVIFCKNCGTRRYANETVCPRCGVSNG